MKKAAKLKSLEKKEAKPRRVLRADLLQARTPLAIFCASMLAVPLSAAESATSDSAPDQGTDATHQSADRRNEAIRSTFSPSALRDIFGDDAANVDFARLIEDADIGRRQYDLFVNNRFLIHQNVEIYRKPDNSLGIRFPAMVLLVQPLLFDELPELKKKRPLDMIEDIDALVPGASVTFDTVNLRADITVPRSWYSSFGIQDDIAPPPRWTYGVPAAVLNYRGSADWERYDGVRRTHAYLGLDARLNFNEWRLYANGAFSADGGETNDTDFDRGSAYITRVFGESRTRLRAGEIYTQSFFQDALPILGLELYDDESMMSTIERGYSPVVSGIAQTAARVTVRQFGRIVYERNVEPGAFSFENLPGLTSGTDLEVTVLEQNGRERRFIVPYNQTALQLRAGRVHYSAALGRWRGTAESTGEKPFVAAAGLGYGLPWDVTVFGAFQASENYFNGTAGTAANLGLLGAASLQFENASYKLDRNNAERTSGSRIALEWQKHFASTGAYLSADWRRYTAGRYLSLSETLAERDSDEWLYSNYGGDLKDELTLSLSQPLGQWGNWNLSGSLFRYEDDRRRESLMTSLTTDWNGISIALSLQHDRNRLAGGENERESILYLNLSAPLSLLFGYEATSQYANLSVQRSDNGSFTVTEGISGSFGENQLWSYALSSSQGQDLSVVNATLSHDTGRGRWMLSASRTHDSTRLSANIDGSLIAAEGELIPAQTLTGATALLKVEHAPDARPETYAVTAKSGDWLVVTGLNNYRINDISIDPNSIPPNVLMPIYRRNLVPADDAVLAVPFETMKGHQLVVEVRDVSGGKLPFGAVARLLAHKSISTMDTVLNERSRAYFGAAPETGVIEVIWSENDVRRTCWAPYSLKKALAEKTDARIVRETVVCHFSSELQAKESSTDRTQNRTSAENTANEMTESDKPRDSTAAPTPRPAKTAVAEKLAVSLPEKTPGETPVRDAATAADNPEHGQTSYPESDDYSPWFQILP